MCFETQIRIGTVATVPGEESKCGTNGTARGGVEGRKIQCIPVGEDTHPGTVAVLGGPPLLIFTGFREEDGEGVARGRVGWVHRSGLVLPEDGITSRDLEAAVRLPSPCR